MSTLPLASSRALWIMLFIDSSVLINDDLSDLICSWDFPGGPMVKNLPASTGYVGSILGLGRSHCCETTTELVFYRVCKPQLLKPACSRACAPQEKLLPWEACTPQLESSSHSPQLEKGWAQQQRPSTAKHKYISKKKIKMPLSQFIRHLCIIETRAKLLFFLPPLVSCFHPLSCSFTIFVYGSITV